MIKCKIWTEETASLGGDLIYANGTMIIFTGNFLPQKVNLVK